MRAVLFALALAASLATLIGNGGGARADYMAGWRAYRAGDYAGAIENWQPLALRGDLDALYNLGALYEGGLGVERSIERAARWYRKAAKLRFGPARYRLARIEVSGLGSRASGSEKALSWYRAAAADGSAEAQYNLGLAYETGMGVALDMGRAVEWYKQAADRGLPTAQYNLGRLHAEGQGVPRNPSLALMWYRRAADAGFAPAQNNLGYMYENGTHLPEDAEKAAYWYRKAADQDLPTAQTNLGIMLNFGLGIAPDAGEAARWYRSAAEQGDAEAQTHLALMLANGQGVDRDFVEAYALFSLAAESEGHITETADGYRERLAQWLDTEEIDAAKQRLTSLRSIMAPTEPALEPALPRDTLAFHSDSVAVQRHLSTLGYYRGVVDAIIGPGTIFAIKRFQHSAGLGEDGAVSRDLAVTLDAAVRKQRAKAQAAD